MSDEHLDSVTEIRLPAKFFRRSVGIAFDVGKSNYTVYNTRRLSRPVMF